MPAGTFSKIKPTPIPVSTPAGINSPPGLSCFFSALSSFAIFPPSINIILPLSTVIYWRI